MRSFRGDSRLIKPPSRAWLVLSILLALAGVAFLALFGYEQYGYLRSSRYYAELQQVACTEEGVAKPASKIDFAALQAINADTADWLEMPGLSVALPVVQAQDNQTWLHQGFDGTPSPEGCLFFAAPCGGQEDLYRVIYGHNLHTGSMFSGLTNYRDQAFWEQNPTFTLCTPQGDETWRIFSCHEATDTEELYRTGRTPGEEYNAFLQELQAASLYDTGVTVPEDARVLTLSTCSTSYGSGLDRFVIHAYCESDSE